MPGAEDVPEASPEPEEPEEPEGEPLTVRFESIPDEHDGHSPVVFRLAFSEAPHQFSYQTLRDETPPGTDLKSVPSQRKNALKWCTIEGQ